MLMWVLFIGLVGLAFFWPHLITRGLEHRLQSRFRKLGVMLTREGWSLSPPSSDVAVRLRTYGPAGEGTDTCPLESLPWKSDWPNQPIEWTWETQGNQRVCLIFHDVRPLAAPWKQDLILDLPRWLARSFARWLNGNPRRFREERLTPFWRDLPAIEDHPVSMGNSLEDEPHV